MLRQRKTRVQHPPEECSLTLCVRFLMGNWTPNVLWYLKGEPRRFSELKSDLKGISSKVLTERLRRLEQDGLIQRRSIPSSPPSVEYSLTELGQKLKPVLEALLEVGRELKEARSASRE